MSASWGLLAIAIAFGLIAWLIDCCCEAIPAILDEVDP